MAINRRVAAPGRAVCDRANAKIGRALARGNPDFVPHQSLLSR